MAATDPWNASFEANPQNADDAGQGDDEILESRKRARARLSRVMDACDPSVISGYGDTGRPVPGSAKPFYQATAPTALQKPDRSNQSLTLGGATQALGSNDDGLLWLLDDTGAYQLFAYDDSASSHGTYGKFRPINNIDPSTMHDDVQLHSDVTSVSSGYATINGTTSKGAGTDMQVSVTVPAAGIWMVELWYTITAECDVTSGGGIGQILYQITVSNALSATWPAGLFESNASSSTLSDTIAGVGGHRIIPAATNGGTYTFTLQHARSVSSATVSTRGDADNSSANASVTRLEAL